MNPLSGGRRADRARAELVRSFEEMAPGGEVCATEGPGDAVDQVRRLLEVGYECVAVAGGDGTFNEAVNGYFRPIDPSTEPGPEDGPEPVNPDACLAVIPCGTGGDFRRTLGLEPDPVAALSLLTGSSFRTCDVGHASFACDDGRSSRFFLNITSFGLSGLVDEYVNTSARSLPGSLAFFVATIRAFMDYENVRVRVLMDRAEQRVDTAVVVVVANGRFFGGGMEVAPVASLDDGLLDVVILGDLGLVDFLAHAPKMYGGRLLEIDRIQHRHAREVILDAVEESDVMLMDMDGEPVGRLPATLRVFPGALRIKT
jgi:YegS/Rv2252/BmrU family lipid kinase